MKTLLGTRSVVFVLAMLGLSVAPTIGNAAPITLLFEYMNRDNASANTVGFAEGDTLAIGVDYVEPVEGTTITATSSDTNTVLNLNPPLPQSLLFPNNFHISIPYDASLAAETWTIDAVNNVGTNDTASATVGPIGPDLVPLVTNLQVEANGLQPIVSWTNPTTGPNIDRIRVSIYEETTDSQFFRSVGLPGDATSYMVPAGVITQSGEYAFRVITDAFTQLGQSRSNTFVNAAVVPAPGTLALLAPALAAFGFIGRQRKQNIQS